MTIRRLECCCFGICTCAAPNQTENIIISYQNRITELDKRVEQLLEANNREVEKRRAMEAKLEAVACALEACMAYVRAK